MKNSRFKELLSILKLDEYERFSDFLHSPFFCRNDRAIKIWDYINSIRKSDCDYSKEELLKAAFGSEKCHEANFRMLLSDFVKLIEQYLLIKEFFSDVIESEFRMLELSQQLKLRKSYSKYKQKCSEYIENADTKDMPYYYRQYLLECIKLITGDNGDLESADEAVTNALIASKFENAIRTRKYSSKVLLLEKELISFVKKNERVYKKNHPLIYERMIELTKTSH